MNTEKHLLATQQALASQASDRDEILDYANTVTVRDEDDYESIGGFLVDVKKEIKNLTAQRETITKPLNEALKKVREMFKPALDSLSSAEIALKSAMLTYKQEEESKRQLLLAAAPKALVAGRHAEAMALINSIKEEPTTKGVSSIKRWKLEVVDAELVPGNFWMIDERALLADAKESGWKEPPPGVRYYQEESMMVRT